VNVQEIEYASVAESDRTDVVEAFLQRCVFDDRIPLAEMRRTEPLASYLSACRHARGWRFGQRVGVLDITA